MEMTSLDYLEIEKGVLFNSWELPLKEEFVDHLARRETPLQYLHFSQETISRPGAFLIDRLIGVTWHCATPCEILSHPLCELPNLNRLQVRPHCRCYWLRKRR
jgi:hypothetical protein